MIETPRNPQETPEEVFERVCTPENLNEILAELVPRFLKKGNEDDETMYGADLRIGRADTTDKHGFFWDTEAGLRLYADGKLLGCIGFIIYKDVVTVAQLQSDALPGAVPPIRWERLLVELLDRVLVRTGGYSALEIMRAEVTNWFDSGDPEITDQELKEYQDRLRRRYDGTARALRFKKGDDCWTRPIVSPTSK